VSAKRTALIGAAYVAAYVALDWASSLDPLGPLAITPWNPPPGLSLALLLADGLRFAPALFIAALVAEVGIRGVPAGLAPAMLSSLVIAAGYAAAAWLFSGPLRADRRLATLRDVAWFSAVVGIATLAVGAGYIAVYTGAGRIAPGDFVRSVLQYWLGDAIGILVTTPALVFLFRPRDALPPLRWSWEAALQGLALLAALWVAFGVEPEGTAPFFYVLFLPLIWISVRHGIAGAAVALLLIQLGIVAAVQLQGYAPATVLELQLLMSALAVTGLFLGGMVSERRRAREALEAREAELASVLRTAPDGIVVFDDSGRIASANDAAGAMFGASAEALTGLGIAELIPNLPLEAAPIRRAERTARRRDGSTFPVELALGRARANARSLYIGVLRDVSERKAIEGRLRERESELDRSLRLAAAAETASALAHELSQPLSAIATYVRACALMLERPDNYHTRLAETMRTVSAEVGRAGEVVRRLRDFFRSGTSRLERVPVGELLQGGADRLARRVERHRIDLRMETAPGLPAVLVDRLQIETVVHNLLANAIDAIIAADSPERTVRIRAAPGPHGSTRITVADSGPGLAGEAVEDMFRPFATTKPDGMGLGLAISRSIVENHGGRLVAEASARGAVFSFTLPGQEAMEMHA
jgi:PAS domain S-box-containing protein